MTKTIVRYKISTPIGNLIALADDTHLIHLSFNEAIEKSLKINGDIPEIKSEKNTIIKQLEEELTLYFQGALQQFSTPLKPNGTDFQEKVWQSLIDIPYGTTVSYADQAIKLGDKKAIRAMASANGKNPIAILVPCHRVIGADGSLTGYAGGLERKRFLLNLERNYAGTPDLFNQL